MTNPRQRNERLTVFSAASNKRRHSCPRHRCFDNIMSHQSGLSRPAQPMLRHLLTKHRPRQRTPLQCHLPSSGASSISARRTHLYSLPNSNHPAAATPTEWQPAPATRVTLLLPGEECESHATDFSSGLRCSSG